MHNGLCKNDHELNIGTVITQNTLNNFILPTTQEFRILFTQMNLFEYPCFEEFKDISISKSATNNA